jgi:hypothetical protein
LIQRAGYLGLRSAEWFSLDLPRRHTELLVMPTTLQAYPHDLLSLAQNVMKRTAFGNLWRFIIHGRSTDWEQLAQCLLSHALSSGGVFHLWGHSWEIQEAGQWNRLERVLQLMGQFTKQAPALTNGQICQRSSPLVSTADVAEQAAASAQRG